MSIPFSDTSTLKGLVQFYEKEIGANPGDVSGNTVKLKQFAAYANLALDDYLNIVLPLDGGWQLDDSNHTDYPERFMTLTSGTRRYALHSFTADVGSNLMLSVYKVFVKLSSGVYQELEPTDVQTEDGTESFTDGQALSGIPYRYDVTGMWLDIDPVPNYTLAQGLKVLISREGSYFTSADTTKKPGIPGNHHKYIFKKAAMWHEQIHNPNHAREIEREVTIMEQRTIPEFYRGRDKKRNVMTGAKILYI